MSKMVRQFGSQNTSQLVGCIVAWLVSSVVDQVACRSSEFKHPVLSNISDATDNNLSLATNKPQHRSFPLILMPYAIIIFLRPNKPQIEKQDLRSFQSFSLDANQISSSQGLSDPLISRCSTAVFSATGSNETGEKSCQQAVSDIFFCFLVHSFFSLLLRSVMIIMSYSIRKVQIFTYLC